ncbi:MAG: DUF1559 domain-containing protein [Planctomycetota bacterium]
MVVISVLGVLITLSIRGLQVARESSRKVSCQNHLRQFGVALLAFESAHDELPSGSGIKNENLRANAVRTDFGSVVYQLASYLELGVGRLHFDAPSYPGHVRHDRFTFEVLSCPSDPVSGGLSYRGNTGSAFQSFRFGDPKYDAKLGPFETPFPIRLNDVTDGLSQTVAFAEKRKGRVDSAVASDEMWSTGITNGITSPRDGEKLKVVCQSLPSMSRRVYERTGYFWNAPGYLHSLYNHWTPPNSVSRMDCSGRTGSLDTKSLEAAIVQASSHHPGGLHVLFLDGSVRFVSESIDEFTWSSIGSRSEGRAIKADLLF